MDNTLQQFYRYLLFFCTWVIAVFMIKLLLKQLKKAGTTNSDSRKKMGSLKSKLPVYVTFQLLLITSISFNRQLFFLIISIITLWSVCELTQQIRICSLNVINKYAITGAGIVLLAGMASGCIYLGKTLATMPLLYLFFCIAISDTFSQVFGESLGGKTCMPRISPAKTWNGLIGGCCMCVIAAGIFYLFFLRGTISLPLLLLSSVMIFIVSTIGDASASLVKRQLNIKDFSTLLGSQGGMIDRIDSLLLVSPVAALVVAIS